MGLPDFPFKVAAIDIGSNALRFSVAEFADVDRFSIVETGRQALRLGHDVFHTGKLTEETLLAAVQGLKSFSQRIAELGAQMSVAVATSAIRESGNQAAFLSLVDEKAGMKVKVITGSEEARLVYLAVKSRIPLGDDPWVLVELGGGSVEVSFANGQGILWSESHTMGSVRLLEELTGDADEPGRFARLLTEYVATLHIPPGLANQKPAGFIATGGNIESLARLASPEAREDGVRTLSLAALKSSIVALSRLSYRQRMEQLDLREDRADVILPAALVYARFAELARAENILVPGVGIREGLMIDLVQNLFHHKQSQDTQSHLTYDAALALGRRYQFEEAHAVQVCRLALSLFDQLTTLHELGEEERRMLLAAALLHDTGFYISYQRHHKHSQYLITQSELPGFSSQDMLLIGMIARYHRKSEPSDRHVDYSALSTADRNRVSRLAAIIRVADALDREHIQKVKGVLLEIGPQTVVVHVDCTGDFLLESWGVRKKADLFEREFHRTIRLALQGSS